ncbi:MAG: hypothetical protein LBU12_09265, partial [Deltaproteobacteria bacterium]|nr:hypothetical protein [Deltaproteobacteria bacterium]
QAPRERRPGFSGDPERRAPAPSFLPRSVPPLSFAGAERRGPGRSLPRAPSACAVRAGNGPRADTGVEPASRASAASSTSLVL